MTSAIFGWSPLWVATTLFVAVNALINAFRVVDQVIAMTGGGPNNVTTLLLFYIFQVAFSFWDTAYAAALSTVYDVVIVSNELPGAGGRERSVPGSPSQVIRNARTPA